LLFWQRLRWSFFSLAIALDRSSFRSRQKVWKAMLETIAIVLIILWLLGLVSSYTLGGFIHILLVVAIVMIVLRLIGNKKPV